MEIMQRRDPPSWKPEVFVDGKWTPNNLAFVTYLEAHVYAEDLFWRWTLTSNYRAVPSHEEPNYTYRNGGLYALPQPSPPETA